MRRQGPHRGGAKERVGTGTRAGARERRRGIGTHAGTPGQGEKDVVSQSEGLGAHIDIMGVLVA